MALMAIRRQVEHQNGISGPALSERSLGSCRSTPSTLFHCEVDADHPAPLLPSKVKSCAYFAALRERLLVFATPTGPALKLQRDVLHYSHVVMREEGRLDVVVLATKLAVVGHLVCIRTALGGGAACFRNLRHEFLAVQGKGDYEGVEFLVEPSFRNQFQIPHPTDEFRELLATAVPTCFVGTAARLTPLVQVLCAEMADSFEMRGLTLPPWRRTAAMLSKWLPSKVRDTSVGQLSPPVSPPNGIVTPGHTTPRIAGTSDDDAPCNAIRPRQQQQQKQQMQPHNGLTSGPQLQGVSPPEPGSAALLRSAAAHVTTHAVVRGGGGSEIQAELSFADSLEAVAVDATSQATAAEPSRGFGFSNTSARCNSVQQKQQQVQTQQQQEGGSRQGEASVHPSLQHGAWGSSPPGPDRPCTVGGSGASAGHTAAANGAIAASSTACAAAPLHPLLTAVLQGFRNGGSGHLAAAATGGAQPSAVSRSAALFSMKDVSGDGSWVPTLLTSQRSNVSSASDPEVSEVGRSGSDERRGLSSAQQSGTGVEAGSGGADNGQQRLWSQRSLESTNSVQPSGRSPPQRSLLSSQLLACGMSPPSAGRREVAAVALATAAMATTAAAAVGVAAGAAACTAATAAATATSAAAAQVETPAVAVAPASEQVAAVGGSKQLFVSC